MITCAFYILFAYFCGSVPFGKIVGKKLYDLDIQKLGSGNIGFANAVRVLGWKAAAIVLAGDVAKGFLPVIIASQRLAGLQLFAVGFAAVAGHIFPLWLKFKGGKGIATCLGVALALTPLLGAFGLIVYLITIAKFRKSAPSSLLAVWCVVVVSAVLARNFTLPYTILAAFVTWAHRSNIRQMMREAVRAG